MLSSHIIRLLGAAALAVALLASPAFAAEGGTIKGKLLNATAGGGSVEGVDVTLTAYFGQTERNKVTARTDAQGGFQFTGLDTSSSYSYEAATNYQKADYSAPRVSFSGADETKEVTLKVYDATSQADVVKTTAKHYLLNAGKGDLEVSEILVMRNDSDKTYVGSREVGTDQRETSRYLPPAGARTLEYGDTLMSCCIVKDGAGFVDTMALFPGETQKIFSYKLPYDGTNLSFATTLQQNVEKVQVLVPNGVRAEISGLASHGTQSVQGTTYQLFSGEKLPADTTLSVDLQGLPQGGIPGGPLALIGVAIGVLAALAAAFLLLRRRAAEPAPVPAYGLPHPATSKRSRRAAATNPALLELEKRDLLAAMANLDDCYEAGQIGRGDYERLRAEKKEKLVHLMRQQTGSRGTPVRT
ncbi:MAG: carboxypeptidase-like regulatory domain-containing protein [Chloroflexota bacterium]